MADNDMQDRDVDVQVEGPKGEAYNPRSRMRISREEWFAISASLEEHHAVFYKVWQMGKPHFTDEIDTAAVQFDETGDFVWFHFNPKFWASLDHYNKLFVICHEALHVILNHGIRISDVGRLNRGACNAALDVVVNHSLLRNFGFERDRIINQEKLCWVDTIFKGRKPLPPDDEMYEFYYSLFEKVYGMGMPGDGDGDGEGDNSMGSMPGGIVDDHSMMGSGKDGKSDDWGKVIDKLQEGLSDEEKDSLKKMVQKHFQKPDKNSKNQPAGTGTGGQWVFANVAKIKKKKKWETVIKKWSAKYLKESDKEIEQWARLNRRMAMLPRDMFLPSDMEIEEEADEKTRIDVWFFLDTSGSCWGLKDRFFAAAMSLPTERFNIRLFCFDTTVEETTLESKKIYGGGGTSFSILEQAIQKELKEGGGIKTTKDGKQVQKIRKYPEAVFVITDGYGDRIAPEKPDKWYWFITSGGSRSYIHKDCNFFNLDDFE